MALRQLEIWKRTLSKDKANKQHTKTTQDDRPSPDAESVPPAVVTQTSIASLVDAAAAEEGNYEALLKKLVVEAEKNKSLFTDESTTSKIRGMFLQTKAHMSRSAKMEERFFNAISDNESLGWLAQFVNDSDGREPIRLFYKMLYGLWDKAKKKMINMCLVVFAETLRKEKARVLTEKLNAVQLLEERENLSMYQPSTLGRMH